MRFLIGHETSNGNRVVSFVMFSVTLYKPQQQQQQQQRCLHYTKGKKHLLVYLEEHVPGLYSPISSHSSSFHDRADVNAAVSPVITLTNNTDTQKVVLLCEGEKKEGV